MQADIINKIIDSNLPINWVTADIFCAVTGIRKSSLAYWKSNYWPEGLVYSKNGKSVFYSIEGFNKWQNEQAEKAYQKGLGLELGQSKSTQAENQQRLTSHSLTRRLQRVSKQPLKLEVT